MADPPPAQPVVPHLPVAAVAVGNGTALRVTASLLRRLRLRLLRLSLLLLHLRLRLLRRLRLGLRRLLRGVLQPRRQHELLELPHVDVLPRPLQLVPHRLQHLLSVRRPEPRRVGLEEAVGEGLARERLAGARGVREVAATEL